MKTADGVSLNERKQVLKLASLTTADMNAYLISSILPIPEWRNPSVRTKTNKIGCSLNKKERKKRNLSGRLAYQKSESVAMGRDEENSVSLEFVCCVPIHCVY